MPRLRNQLPEKLSDLLELALKDMAKCKRSKKFQIDLNIWFTPMSKGCTVCLAGSVLAQTVGIDPKMPSLTRGQNHPIGFVNRKLITRHDEKRIQALDSLRKGYIKTALLEIGQKRLARDVKVNALVMNRDYDERADPDSDYKSFRKDMLKILKVLKAIGA